MNLHTVFKFANYALCANKLLRQDSDYDPFRV